MLDPYHRWLGIPRHLRPPTYYQLLGIAPDETDREVIEEAALRQTSHVRTYQTGPYAQPCTALLNEIAQAKATLLNPARRRDYDARLAEAQAAAAPPPPPPPADDEPDWPGADAVFTPGPLPELPSFPAFTDAAPPAFFPTEGPIAAPADLARYRDRGSGLAPFLVGAAYLALLLLGGAVTFKLSFDSAAAPAGAPAPPEAAPPEPSSPPAPRWTKLTGQESIVRAIAWLPDGRLVTGGGVLYGPGGGRFDCTVHLWSVKQATLVRTFRGPDAPIGCLAVSTDGGKLLAGGGAYQPDLTGGVSDCRARLYDVGTEAPRKVLEGHGAPLTGVAFVPTTQQAVTCGEDFTARVYDLASGRQERLVDKLPAIPRGIAVAPNGREAIISCAGGWVRLWDLGGGLMRGVEEKLSETLAVGYGAAGWRVVGRPEAARESGLAVVGDGPGGKLRRPLEGAPRTALCWAFSADATLLACGTSDGQVIVWLSGTGRELQRFHDAGRPVTAVAVLAGARQGDAVAAGTADGTVWSWPLSSSR